MCKTKESLFQCQFSCFSFSVWTCWGIVSTTWTGNTAVLQLSLFLPMRENMVVKLLWRLFGWLQIMWKLIIASCILILLRYKVIYLFIFKILNWLVIDACAWVNPCLVIWLGFAFIGCELLGKETLVCFLSSYCIDRLELQRCFPTYTIKSCTQ